MQFWTENDLVFKFKHENLIMLQQNILKSSCLFTDKLVIKYNTYSKDKEELNEYGTEGLNSTNKHAK